MSTELLAMLGGGASGFLFKLIGTLVQNQAAVTEGLIKKQQGYLIIPDIPRTVVLIDDELSFTMVLK